MSKYLLSIVTLFSSVTTLFCCALPALFVALGLGASLVSILGAVPELIWFSENKELVFLIAGTLLLINFAMKHYSTATSCPSDGSTGEVCATTKNMSAKLLYVSSIIYLVGACFAFSSP